MKIVALYGSSRRGGNSLFATPLYWYGMSGRMKNFIDRWSQSLAYIFEFVGLKFAGYVIGQGNKPGQVLQDEVALYQADQINREVGGVSEQG